RVGAPGQASPAKRECSGENARRGLPPRDATLRWSADNHAAGGAAGLRRHCARRCGLRMYRSSARRSGGKDPRDRARELLALDLFRGALLPLQGPEADVAAAEPVGPADAIDCTVGARARLADRFTKRTDVEHATAIGEDFSPFGLCAPLKNFHPLHPLPT